MIVRNNNFIQMDLSSSQILNLATTSIKIINPPGVGKCIIVRGVIIKYVPSSIAYVSVLNPGVRIGHPGVSDQFADTGLLYLSLSPGMNTLGMINESGNIVENAAIHIKKNGLNFTLGNGTISVMVNYDIVEMSSITLNLL